MSYVKEVLKILNFWRDFLIFLGFEFGNWGNGLFYFFGIGGTNPVLRSVLKSPSGGMQYCFNAAGGCTCKKWAKNKPGVTPGRSHLLYLQAKYIVNIMTINNIMPFYNPLVSSKQRHPVALVTLIPGAGDCIRLPLDATYVSVHHASTCWAHARYCLAC